MNDEQKRKEDLEAAEDEMIRKSLIRSFTNQHSSNFPTTDGFTREQILAWLEKQREKKSADKVKSTEHNYITENSEFFQWIYDRLKYVYNEDPNVDYMLSLKERIENMQKPSDKINTYCQENCKGFQETGKCFCDGECDAKRKSERVHPQPKQEWNEEDKKELKVIIDELKRYVMFKQYGTPLSVYDISWLEELPSRFIIQQQPQQNWNEEDKYMFNLISNLSLTGYKKHPKLPSWDFIKNWLESIKPQNHWKPSEKQMEALKKECLAHSNYELCRLLEELENL